jgi:predicted NBD/HSP70 family sugar kinase
MASPEIGTGVVLGLGATNARYGMFEHGEVYSSTTIPTPQDPEEFFGWMTRQALDAAHQGHSWLVAGFPGPVSPDGTNIGPMENVPGVGDETHHLLDKLVETDSAMTSLLEAGFRVVPVNDGELAAHAAASRIGEYGYDRVAALILGSGVGCGVVGRDVSAGPDVYRADKSNPLELGHLPLSSDPTDTFENLVSGTALARRYKIDPETEPASHPAWEEVGVNVAQMSLTLGLMSGVDLVVPCGGVGSGASARYEAHLRQALEDFASQGNKPQRKFLPEVQPVPNYICQVFELYGGEGVMRDLLTQEQYS